MSEVPAAAEAPAEAPVEATVSSAATIGPVETETHKPKPMGRPVGAKDSKPRQRKRVEVRGTYRNSPTRAQIGTTCKNSGTCVVSTPISKNAAERDEQASVDFERHGA